MNNYVEISEFIGKTFNKIDVIKKSEQRELNKFHNDGDYIVFYTDNEIYTMYHDQDCCEEVNIVDICGDIQSIVGELVIKAESLSNEIPSSNLDWDSQTWTFYHITTQKTSITIRWHGSSNGYYSESVEILKEEYKN